MSRVVVQGASVASTRLGSVAEAKQLSAGGRPTQRQGGVQPAEVPRGAALVHVLIDGFVDMDPAKLTFGSAAAQVVLLGALGGIAQMKLYTLAGGVQPATS